MPSGPASQKFSASSTVIVLLTVLGLGTRYLKQYVPTESENLFAGSSEDYLTAAKGHEIQWRELGSEAFVDARRQDRLVMIVIGDVPSRMARYADRFGFLDRDATDRIRSTVIPVKIDASQYPALVYSFLPFSRTQVGFDPLFQVWFLDPEGELVSRGILGSAAQLVERRWVLDRIAEAEQSWKLKRKGDAGENRQTADLALLDLPAEPPDYDQHIDGLRSLLVPGGGMVFLNQQQFWPQSLRLFQVQGTAADVTNTLSPILKSSLVDWLDGGFFRQMVDTKWRQVEYDKLAIPNAEMAVVTAVQWRKTGDPFALRIARDTFDCLIHQFSDGEHIRGYRVGDGDLVRRSKRSSFSPRFLRQTFGAAEREWYRDRLDLRVEDNEQMAVRIDDPNLVSDPLLDTMLAKLRAAKEGEVPAYGGAHQLDFAASALARLMEAARYLKDATRQQELIALGDQLSQFRAGLDDVRKRLTNDATPATLRDYLAYSDVCLQEYESYGRADRLEEGAAVLRRGLAIFRGTRSGELVEGRWPIDSLAPPNSASPDLTDVLGESSVAMAIRLTYAYGVLEQAYDSVPAGANPDTRDLVAFSRSIVSRFAAVANRMRVQVSAYYIASAMTEDDRHCFAIGPEAPQLALDARCRVGTKLTIPLWNFGGSTPREPGLYVVQGNSWQGPLTLDQFEKTVGPDRTATSPARP